MWTSDSLSGPGKQAASSAPAIVFTAGCCWACQGAGLLRSQPGTRLDRLSWCACGASMRRSPHI